MQAPRLNPTSYIVLGLLEQAGEATPYDLKRMVAASVGNLWSMQHAQLYTEPERLARAGLVSERREQEGRRRKRYQLTDAGRQALQTWRAHPTSDLAELRDPGLLQLFFGADPQPLADAQLQAHRAKLEAYEELRAAAAGQPSSGPLLALEAGIGHERESIRFWSGLKERSPRG